MDSYPQDYISHNRPLLLLSGLQDAPPSDEPVPDSLLEKGVKIVSDFPSLQGPIAEDLRNAFFEQDGSRVAKTRNSEDGFKIKSIGRVG